VTRAQHALPADTVALRGAGEVQAVLRTLRALGKCDSQKEEQSSYCYA